ncbi:MAG: twin-arginine translocation signal domain-containing protein [Deltaproteobacteria bacterium]|nr:twin-arginine translocation signal domain-containing protein [Deltaproteobacteria bacterium]
MKKRMNRRQFLQTSSLAIAGAAVAGGTGALLLDSTTAWAAKKATLDEHTTKTLIAMCRQLYPHKLIEDAEYGKAVEGFAKTASSDSAFAKLLQEGVAALDAAAKGKWVEATDEDRFKVLKGMESSPFFQAVRGPLVGPGGPYNLPSVWKKFGYEGSSWQLGGYLARGFDDIKWLPKE